MQKLLHWICVVLPVTYITTVVQMKLQLWLSLETKCSFVGVKLNPVTELQIKVMMLLTLSHSVLGPQTSF